ncbi:MAG: hypothetical protein KDH16_19755, partial [Rhodocyclaceae bacterium]|nr:hypothetical protein [Rhodocyclaceae bacterium]
MPIKLPSPDEIIAGSPFAQKKPASSLSDFKAAQPKRKSSLADFQTAQQQAPQNQGSVLGDIGHGLAAGTANLAGAIGDIPNLLTAGAVPPLSPSLSAFS